MSALPLCHSERSGAERNGVEESRGGTFQVTQRDPSTSLRMTGAAPSFPEIGL